MIFCGFCGDPYSLRGSDRFACSNHISKGTCSNSRTISRKDLERRVLAGLEGRMMAPEIAAGDRADARRGARREFRGAARRTAHHARMDRAPGSPKDRQKNKTRSRGCGFVAISGCGGRI
ncbi:zinc ribbon domain-containing protein [Ancylobacter vacuolatus]|uniref:zinc ribbon domain-containing protein n=1 Tax=Ancylobacter vacuolatus TaxID=223389 RepID=UPI0027D855DA|nr:zinc ribbon domain-containing protein [Ancylobacter vacuolatus]